MMKTNSTTLLTDRQVKLITYMALGLTREQMADKILRGIDMVDKEIQAIYKALGINTFAGAVNACWEHGIFTREGEGVK